METIGLDQRSIEALVGCWSKGASASVYGGCGTKKSNRSLVTGGSATVARPVKAMRGSIAGPRDRSASCIGG